MNLDLFLYSVSIILCIYSIFSGIFLCIQTGDKNDIFILVPILILALLFYYCTMGGLATFLICK